VNERGRPTLWEKIGAVAGVAGAIVGAIALWPIFFPAPPPPPPSISTVLLKQATENPGLYIADADVETEVFKQYVLWFIPAGADNFYIFNITIRNTERVPRESCYVVTQYATEAGHGEALLFMGNWPDWYGKGVAPDFKLPGDPAFSRKFFTQPDPEALRRLEWARIRVVCQLPNVQISPWHDVDLSRVRWQ
jgi:hypothetical protein